ncbi:MAG: hypothetical protein SGBAC_003322 [Bacillariaceae sp.]
MIKLWDHAILRINKFYAVLLLAASSWSEVESNPWNHPEFTDVSPRCHSQYVETVDVSMLCRGGESERSLEYMKNKESQLPRKKFFRKKRGSLNINLGKPKEKYLPSDDESKALPLPLPLPWYPRKAPAAKPASQVAFRKDDSKTGNDAEVKLSMDVFALLRLAQHLGAAGHVAFAACSATLKMLGPMVMTQKCFEWLVIGPKGYDQYNGQKAIEKPVGRMEKYGIVEGLRAVGRVVVRFCGMYLFGMFCTSVLSASPCAMPEQFCKYWYGLVWTLGVKFIAHANELVVSNEGWMKMYDQGLLKQSSHFFHRFHTVMQFMRYLGLFEVRPERSYFPLLPPARIFKIPSPTIRWMYLFFGVVDNVLKVHSDEEAMSSQVISPLFPSTWPYFQLMNIVAMARLMKQCLPECPKALLIGFCLQAAVYEEWFRVFLKERRVDLGVVMSTASLLATTYFIYATASIDQLAAFMLLPFGLATVIATWVNFVLCGKDFEPTKRPTRPRYVRIE